MKVAFLSREYPPDTAWGGIATVYHDLAHALTERGHEVHVICQAVAEPNDHMDNGVFVHRVGTNPKRYSAIARINYSFYAWLKLREVIRKYDVEIVHAACWGAEGFLYSIRKQTPLVVGLHSSANDVIRARTYSGIEEQIDLRILSWLENFTVKRADMIAANSQATYTQAIERLRIDPESVKIVHHAIDIQKFKYVESDIRERLQITSDAGMVLFIGRLEARKGVHVLCEAIPEVITSMPLTKFVLVGRDTNTAPDGGSVKSYIMEQARGHGFLDSLVFIDFLPLEELIQLYSACDLFVLPSLYETFGLVTMEAMACGKPVVATSTGIVPELELDGENGIMVPPGDAGALAEGLIKLLSLKDEHKRLIAKNNRELTEARFSIPEWANKMVQVYEKALK